MLDSLHAGVEPAGQAQDAVCRQLPGDGPGWQGRIGYVRRLQYRPDRVKAFFRASKTRLSAMRLLTTGVIKL